MRILNIAYPFAPVRPNTAGGAEHVLRMLDEGLTAYGHTSIVVALHGSVSTGRLFTFHAPEGAITGEKKEKVYHDLKSVIEVALEVYRPDVVHMHGVDFYRYMPTVPVPVLVTLHLPFKWYPEAAFSHSHDSVSYNCVSQTQLRTIDAEMLKGRVHVIENGVPVEDYPAGISKRGYALCLGRVCPEKGFHHALHAAKLAGVPLIIAGEVFGYPEHDRYFKKEIFPMLSSTSRFIGPVGFERKRRLLAGARCLLVPSLAEETSSLVAMEAISAGTPVIAYPSGALPEIVEEGRTGFIVNGAAEMSEAIRKADSLDPEELKKTARERFSSREMVKRYIGLYKELTAGYRKEAIWT